MKSHNVKIGVAVLILLVLLPLYLFFNNAEGKGEESSTFGTLEKVAGKQGVKENSDKAFPGTNNEKETAGEESRTVPDTNGNSEGIAESDQIKAIQSGFLVVIDPGHQEHANLEKEPVGPGAKETKFKVTGGTSGVVTKKPEYQLTLEASLILGELLQKKGVKVIFTRKTHNVNLSNRDRAEIANQHHADLFIRIHADGSTDENVSGLSVLTPEDNSPYTKGIYEDSLKASQFIINVTRENSAVKVNGISFRGDLTGFNWSNVPCTLVEMGFMSNPAEDRNLSDPVYLRNLMTNVADGILQYASYKK